MPKKKSKASKSKKQSKSTNPIIRFAKGTWKVLKVIYNFFKRVFERFYNWAVNPEEKEKLFHARIFGRTLTFAGYMALMIIGIVLVTALLTNRSVGIDKEEIVLTGLAQDFEGYNILVISDMSGRTFGQDQSTLMRQLDTVKYSCVLFAGDMVGPSGDTDAFYTLIEQLGNKKPIYFIAGDSDPSPILETPRDSSSGTLTWTQVVYAPWVLGAIERGAIYLDTPQKITKGSRTLWLMPDTFLNLNVLDALDAYKEELAQEQDAYLEGVKRTEKTLPLTNYRRNILFKASELISSINDSDLIIMVSHEVPSDAQLNAAQEELTEDEVKSFFLAPDLVVCGHYCAGEWRLPLIGALHVSSDVLPRYGWFPDDKYVRGTRTVGGITVYTTAGLGANNATHFWGRVNNPPRVSLLTLTGELPASFLD